MEHKKMEWGDLETFVNVGAKLSTATITINPNQTFTLNAGFVHQAQKQIENNSHVILSYSRHNNAIVFEFTSKSNNKGTIKMTRQANISIAARSFFNYYQLNVDDFKGKFTPEMLEIPKKGNCWVIFLNKKK